MGLAVGTRSNGPSPSGRNSSMMEPNGRSTNSGNSAVESSTSSWNPNAETTSNAAVGRTSVGVMLEADQVCPLNKPPETLIADR